MVNFATALQKVLRRFAVTSGLWKSFLFLIYSYAITQTVDWFLILVPIIGIFFIFRFAWAVFAWRKPLSIEMEKVERVAFWGISLTSLGILTLEYVATRFLNFYVFYVFVAGLLIKTILSFPRLYKI